MRLKVTGTKETAAPSVSLKPNHAEHGAQTTKAAPDSLTPAVGITADSPVQRDWNASR